MSIRLMSRVWDLDLRHTAKLVLLALADWANDEGACWPSIATLERRCGLSDRGVRNVLDELEAEGRVRRMQRSGRSTMFHITPEGRDLNPGTTFTPPLNLVPVTPARRSPRTQRILPRNPQRNRRARERGRRRFECRRV